MTQSRWSDLRPRILSAVAMLFVGGAALWAGGLIFAELVVLLCGAMIWELGRMTERGSVALGLAVLSSLCLAVSLYLLHRGELGFGLALVCLPAVVGALYGAEVGRRTFFVYGLLILLSGLALAMLRGTSLLPVFWVLSVVVASDIMGYFAGRILGGPKFWPHFSPKKTWSGTVAGWLGAVCVGLAFYRMTPVSSAVIWVSPLIAFAGQMGDIGESAIKRRAGIKDSSNLIPGHGGLLDRFDAVIAAAVASIPFVAMLGFGG